MPDKTIVFLKSIFVFVLILVSLTSAQGSGTLRGLVTDSTSGEPLAFGNVMIADLAIGASTDDRGYFVIASVPAGSYSLLVSYVGYKSKSVSILIVDGKMTHVDIALEPSSYEIGEVEKVGERFHKETTTEVSLEKISVSKIEALPKGVETDVLRSLTFLPGVQSAGDVSAKFYVRGSPSDQNQILFNGVPLYYPFHALGMFSVTDPEILSSVEFLKGGFTCEYTGAISSVLDMKTKLGNKKKFGFTSAVSFLTAKAQIEGPIPYGSFVINGRMSHSNSVLQKFTHQNIPIDFYDLSFNIHYANDVFMKNSTFNFFGFFSKDNIRNNNPELEDFNWSNNIIGFNYFQIEEKAPFFAEILAYLSVARGEVIPNQSESRARENQIKDITLKADFHYVYSNKNELVTGLLIKGVYTDLILQKALEDTTSLNRKGDNLSVFMKYKFLQIKNFGADFGSRLNLTRLAGGGHDEIFIEPRVNLLYKLTPSVSLKAAWGLYQQDLVAITDEDEVVSLFDPWAITPLYLIPANSIQYIAGLTIDITPSLRLETEGYYKALHDLPVLNEKRYFITQNEFVSGSGEAYGLEASLKYDDGPLQFTTNYSLGWAFKTVDGVTYRPRYDSRHKLSLIGSYNLGGGWTTSIIWNYSSGFNFTQLAGYYYQYKPGDLSTGDVFSGGFTMESILGKRNAKTMPDYHRLDINVSKRFKIGPTKFLFDLNLVNVYDRKNLFYFDRDTGDRVNMLPFLPTASIKMEL